MKQIFHNAGIYNGNGERCLDSWDSVEKERLIRLSVTQCPQGCASLSRNQSPRRSPDGRCQERQCKSSQNGSLHHTTWI